MMRKMNKGMTLVALIVTIIVLLILAGITLNLVQGQNGVLTRAEDAVGRHYIGEETEKIEIAYKTAEIDERIAGRNFSFTEKREILKNEIKEPSNVEVNPYAGNEGSSKAAVVFPDTGDVYVIDFTTGKVKLIGKQDESIPVSEIEESDIKWDTESNNTDDGWTNQDVKTTISLGENLNEDAYEIYWTRTPDDESSYVEYNGEEIVSIENQVYTGEKVEPEIVIKDGENIVPNTEYTVGYSNNIKPGIANVTIKNVDGGNYIVETTELTFVIIEPGTVDYIEPKTPNANNAKVTETPEEVIAKIN